MNYKLSLKSKRLVSGKCQVKFVVSDSKTDLLYGYVLSEAGATLKDVVGKIETEVKLTQSSDQIYHNHLYNLHSKQQPRDILIFKN
ncbi:hypothetical protein [Fulvivirga lutea]|uniref:Uncharacterized protein n=1 Tax=Fulvivirga lutea TaxID=2810512 RepID=A0A975A036_9BACT|nr:hypothetical protein [Fulvivirga lutea]QSE96846.1 hypothetical protein JR347_14765 [Fulvivirga lutea]